MSVWMTFCLICIIYFERKEIDRVGEKIIARLKFEWNYYRIRKSIKKENKRWG